MNSTAQDNPSNPYFAPGRYTHALLRSIEQVPEVSTNEALVAILTEVIPFNERLTAFIAERFDVPDTAQSARAVLRRESEQQGLGFSSALLSKWLTKERLEVNISSRSLFKLCLALHLNLEESREFAYRCLRQNWLNCRVAEEAVYVFFIAGQSLFGDDAFRKTEEVLAWLGDTRRESPQGNWPAQYDAPGFTRVIGEELTGLISEECADPDRAIMRLKDFLAANVPLFTGVRLSALRTYNMFLSEGGVGIEPLTSLYHRTTGLTLPESSYLDPAHALKDPTRKRLLWGAAGRTAWLKSNERDGDLLDENEIKLEEHAVGRFQREGVPRGNMIALLFFHFCLENSERLAEQGSRESLFRQFYETTNRTLVDACGMTPLYPRKAFDALFLRSIANSGGTDPVVYLNTLLSDFYAKGLKG